jgi:hypothetical protein
MHRGNYLLNRQIQIGRGEIGKSLELRAGRPFCSAQKNGICLVSRFSKGLRLARSLYTHALGQSQ